MIGLTLVSECSMRIEKLIESISRHRRIATQRTCLRRISKCIAAESPHKQPNEVDILELEHVFCNVPPLRRRYESKSQYPQSQSQRHNRSNSLTRHFVARHSVSITPSHLFLPTDSSESLLFCQKQLSVCSKSTRAAIRIARKITYHLALIQMSSACSNLIRTPTEIITNQ